MRKVSRWMTAACATALLTGFGSVARAQDPDEDDVEINVDADDGDVTVDTDDDDYLYDVDEGDDDDNGLMTGFGTSMQVGGGVFGFTDNATDNFMDTGASWTARLVLGTRMPLALEAAYIGTANGISALGLDDDTVLLSNGAEADLRWNILSTILDSIDLGGAYLDPYIFGGIAFKNYRLVNDDFNTSSVQNSENVGEVPFGGGIAVGFGGGFVVDARGEYRLAFGDDLFADTDQNGLNNWNVSGRLGWEF